jgi:hypothetical protein
VGYVEAFTSNFVSLYRDVHDRIRDEVSDLGERALGWVPGPETNSIPTIVIHLLGSETEVLQVVRDLPVELFWLLNSYGHVREHLAQIQLTKRLWLQPHEMGPPTP